jgi:hypothetical protein
MVLKSSSSDHIPVGISFGCPRGKGSPHIPRWMVEDALFGEIFSGLLAGSGLVAMASSDPFRAHNEFVSLAFKAKKHYFLERDETAQREASSHACLSACLKGLRLLSQKPVDQEAMDGLCHQYPSIGELAVRLEGGGTCVARLRAEAERLIRGEHEREAKARAFSPPSCRSSSMLTGLKSRLPSASLV